MNSLIDRMTAIHKLRTYKSGTNKNYDLGLDAAINVLQRLPDCEQWIQVEEDLPDPDQDVTVMCIESDGHHYIRDAVYDGSSFRIGSAISKTVTAWKPKQEE